MQKFPATFPRLVRRLQRVCAVALLFVVAAGTASAGPPYDLAPFSELDTAGTGFPELQGYLPPDSASGYNQANVTQNGSNNQFMAYQYGGYNSIVAQQVGNANVAAMLQVGLYNDISLTQTGEANRSVILQGGVQNSAQVSQNGVNNLALVLQLGVGMRVAVTQNGNNNSARVVQR